MSGTESRSSLVSPGVSEGPDMNPPEATQIPRPIAASRTTPTETSLPKAVSDATPSGSGTDSHDARLCGYSPAGFVGVPRGLRQDGLVTDDMDGPGHSPPEPGAEQLPFIDLVPEGWRDGPDLWCRAYRMIGVPLVVVKPPVTVDLRHQVVVFLWGSMPRQSLDYEFAPTADGTLSINVKSQEGSHPTAPTALVMTRIESE